jgi:endonuclease III
MPRENFKAKAARCAEVLQRLNAAYPDAHCELNHANPLELLIATILSAQCTDKQVNIVTAQLFQKYKTAADYANAPLPELEQDLRAIGLYRNKAKNIQACCCTLLERHNGEVPADMEALVQLGGVGRKTANVVLGNAFNINEGVVVDTHVARLSGRLDFTRETKPEKIEAALQALTPRDQWTMVSHWLIWHGRRRCFARNPDCPGCEVKELCPSAFRVSKLASAEKP